MMAIIVVITVNNIPKETITKLFELNLLAQFLRLNVARLYRMIAFL